MLCPFGDEGAADVDGVEEVSPDSAGDAAGADGEDAFCADPVCEDEPELAVGADAVLCVEPFDGGAPDDVEAGAGVPLPEPPPAVEDDEPDGGGVEAELPDEVGAEDALCADPLCEDEPELAVGAGVPLPEPLPAVEGDEPDGGGVEAELPDEAGAEDALCADPLCDDGPELAVGADDDELEAGAGVPLPEPLPAVEGDEPDGGGVEAELPDAAGAEDALCVDPLCEDGLEFVDDPAAVDEDGE